VDEEQLSRLVQAEEQMDLLELEDAKKSVLLWGRYFMPHRFTTETQSSLHYYLDDKLSAMEAADVAGPREWAKSTLAAVVAPTMWTCEVEKYGRRFITICCNTLGLANDWLKEIQTEFEQNELILEHYGNLRGSPWREGYLAFNNGVHIRATHLRGRVRGWMRMGFRPQVIVCDDLEDYQDVVTEKRREKNWQWFHTALMGGAANDCVFFCIGNLIHQHMILAKRIKQNRGESFKALDAHDQSTWEEHKPTAVLHKRREEMGEAFFNQEFMGMPLTAGQLAAFLDAMLHDFSPFTRADIGQFKEIWVGIDLAKSLTDDADFTAFAMVGIRGPEDLEEYHILDLFREKIAIPNHLDALKDWIGQDKITGYVVESIGFQEELAADIEDWLDETQQHDVYVHRYTPKDPKERRLYRMLKACGGAKRLKIANIPLAETWVEQAKTIDDPDEHDDLVDPVTSIHASLAPARLRMRMTG